MLLSAHIHAFVSKPRSHVHCVLNDAGGQSLKRPANSTGLYLRENHQDRSAWTYCFLDLVPLSLDIHCARY